jgi:predicted ATP-grasp superfamily ATP-dependent carboligase
VLALGPGNALVATSDHWLEFVMRHRDALERVYATILHPANAALNVCLHKREFVEFCRQADLPVPTTWFVASEARPLGLDCPVILRPSHTRHQGAAVHSIPKAVEAHDEAELKTWLATFAAHDCAAVVATSLLGRRLVQYSVPYAVMSGVAPGACAPEHILAFVASKRRPLPDRCSVGCYVELSPQAEVLALARRAILALDLRGIGEVEILHDADTGENFLIEINARPWLQYALAPASGHDFLAACLGLASRPSLPRARQQGLAWIDLKPDLYNAFSRRNGAVRRGEIRLLDYLRSLLRPAIHAKFDWRDPVPVMHAWWQRGRQTGAVARSDRRRAS